MRLAGQYDSNQNSVSALHQAVSALGLSSMTVSVSRTCVLVLLDVLGPLGVLSPVGTFSLKENIKIRRLDSVCPKIPQSATAERPEKDHCVYTRVLCSRKIWDRNGGR